MASYKSMIDSFLPEVIIDSVRVSVLIAVRVFDILIFLSAQTLPCRI